MPFQALLGVCVIVASCFIASTNRREVVWSTVFTGLALQVVIAALLLNDSSSVGMLRGLSALVEQITGFARVGTETLFGDLAKGKTVFALSVLPLIIYFSALMSVLFHLGIMQRAIFGCAWLLRTVYGRPLAATEAVVAAANMFLGQTEAPLCIRPAIPNLSTSQLMAIMTCGFATMAAQVLPIYATFLAPTPLYYNNASDPKIVGYLLVATAMSIPAALTVSRLLVPSTGSPSEELELIHTPDIDSRTVLDAAASGAATGLRLSANIGAMILAVAGLFGMLDWLVSGVGEVMGTSGLTTASLLGFIFRPAAWLIGIPWQDSHTVASFMGGEIVRTEFLTYWDLSEFQRGPAPLGERTFIITVFALASFANIPSIAVQIGGLSALAPNLKDDIVRLAPKAMVAGLLATWMTAAIAGIVLDVGQWWS